MLLILLFSCGKDEDNSTTGSSSNNTPGVDLSGTWKGHLVSPNCVTTSGCNDNGHLESNSNVTFSQNGNAITINGLIGYVPEPFPGSLQNNVINIPYFDSPSQAFNIRTGTITINGNSALVEMEVFTYGTLNGMPTGTVCCTYYCSWTLTKQ